MAAGRRIKKMYAKKSGVTKYFITMILFAVMMMALTGVSAMAEQLADIQEGTYYIKAVNGNAEGQVLYWDEKASDQNTSMMFEACGGSHADNEVWFITKNRNFDDYYGIYLYKDYTPRIQYWKDKCKRIEIDNLTGRDQPYLTSTTGPHVFCGNFGNQDDAFRFYCQNGTNSYTNLIIESRNDKYRFFRHKEVKVFHADLIYVKANTKHDTSDKLWELIPVNYVKSMSKAAPSLSAQKNGMVTVNWDRFRDKIKNSKVWKSAKYIEVQYSTDKDFLQDVKTKKIRKGSVNKAKAKSALSKLERKKTYYIRARLLDEQGLGSNWSKVVKVRTKK